MIGWGYRSQAGADRMYVRDLIRRRTLPFEDMQQMRRYEAARPIRLSGGHRRTPIALQGVSPVVPGGAESIQSGPVAACDTLSRSVTAVSLQPLRRTQGTGSLRTTRARRFTPAIVVSGVFLGLQGRSSSSVSRSRDRKDPSEPGTSSCCEPNSCSGVPSGPSMCRLRRERPTCLGLRSRSRK